MGLIDWFRRRKEMRKMERDFEEVLKKFDESQKKNDYFINFKVVEMNEPPSSRRQYKRRSPRFFTGGIDVFVSSKCVFSYAYATPKVDIYEAYVEWAMLNNQKIKDMSHFFENFVYQCRGQNIKDSTIDGVHCYRGIAIKA